MHNTLLTTWGLPVNNLFKPVGVSCQYLPTPRAYVSLSLRLAGDNHRFILVQPGSYSTTIPHVISLLFNLLPGWFYPLSTPPITTNVKKGFKK